MVSEDCTAGRGRKRYRSVGDPIRTASDYHQPSWRDWSTRLPSMLASERPEEEEEEEEAPGEEEEGDREAPEEEEDRKKAEG